MLKLHGRAGHKNTQDRPRITVDEILPTVMARTHAKLHPEDITKGTVWKLSSSAIRMEFPRNEDGSDHNTK